MTMPIDIAAVNWPYVLLLSAIAFVAALLGNIIPNRFVAAILAGILFCVGFVFLTYYPHGLPLPLSAK
jgi:hypothetical protein